MTLIVNYLKFKHKWTWPPIMFKYYSSKNLQIWMFDWWRWNSLDHFKSWHDTNGPTFNSEKLICILFGSSSKLFQWISVSGLSNLTFVPVIYYFFRIFKNMLIRTVYNTIITHSEECQQKESCSWCPLLYWIPLLSFI